MALAAYEVCLKSAEVITMTIRETIFSQIQQIAKEHDKRTLPRLTDDLIILESGLDSLEFAILVARLEDELGVDPFSSADEVDFPITFGDFVRLYENADRANDVAQA
jgi:acyl carrier protein